MPRLTYARRLEKFKAQAKIKSTKSVKRIISKAKKAEYAVNRALNKPMRYSYEPYHRKSQTWHFIEWAKRII